ncbi:MAG: hypothetical protein ACXV3A_05245 [Kineosporiaceae bacterium]
MKSVPMPGRLGRRSARHARRRPGGNATGDITAAADHIEAVRLAPGVHDRSQAKSVSWQGTHQVDHDQATEPKNHP